MDKEMGASNDFSKAEMAAAKDEVTAHINALPTHEAKDLYIAELTKTKDEQFAKTLRKSMTSTSAVLPEYQEALSWAGFVDGEPMTIAGASQQPGADPNDQHALGYAMKEHQIVGKSVLPG
jgi:hypothetical protein